MSANQKTLFIQLFCTGGRMLHLVSIALLSILPMVTPGAADRSYRADELYSPAIATSQDRQEVVRPVVYFDAPPHAAGGPLLR
jgi:hypothetical protein